MNATILSLLHLIDARKDGVIGGAAVDAKIEELETRLTDAGICVAVLTIEDDPFEDTND